MYTILIADDESIERQGLRFLIETKGYELNVLEAVNGENALDIINNTHIDVLITDIRMPFMDGLELARRVRQNDAEMKILISTAYGEFEYARQAIRTGAIGYLLKPVQRAEFYEQLDRVIAELDSAQMSAANAQDDTPADAAESARLSIEKCWYDITHGHEINESMRTRLGRYGVDADMVRPVLALVQVASDDAQEEDASVFAPTGASQLTNGQTGNDSRLSSHIEQFEHGLAAYAQGAWVLDASRAMLLFSDLGHTRLPGGSNTLWNNAESSERNEVQLAGLARRIQWLTYLSTAGNTASNMELMGEEESIPNTSLPSVVIAQPSTGAYGLSRAWQLMEEQSESRLRQSGTVHILGLHDTGEDAAMLERLNQLLGNIERALDREDYAGAYAYIEVFTECMKSFNDASALYMRYMAMEAISAIIKSRRGTNSGRAKTALKDALDSVFAAHDIQQMILLVDDYTRTLIAEHRIGADDNDAVECILKTIHEHYAEVLTLDMLARSVYMTPSYVSYLFKRRTGSTLIKYIADYRMGQAADLLATGHAPVTEIAQLVGYDNSSYFGSIFKAHYGISPARYRQQRLDMSAKSTPEKGASMNAQANKGAQPET